MCKANSWYEMIYVYFFLTFLCQDYQGHVFWDQETWMLPPIMMFHPEVAKLMLKSRIRRLAAAKQNAAKNGHTGAQYPWESAYTGRY